MSDGSSPLLSVVVPIKDEIDILPELTRRIGESRPRELADPEVVNVDHRSTDWIAPWIACRQPQDPPIKIIRQ
jgi:hypothetical protein